MIVNIVDDRKNKYQWKNVWGTIEPTCNGNSYKDADQTPFDNRSGFIKCTSKAMTLNEVLIWAQQFEGNNTLYLRNTNPMEFVRLDSLKKE